MSSPVARLLKLEVQVKQPSRGSTAVCFAHVSGGEVDPVRPLEARRTNVRLEIRLTVSLSQFRQSSSGGDEPVMEMFAGAARTPARYPLQENSAAKATGPIAVSVEDLARMPTSEVSH
jgi:hypothetical protein